MLFSSHEDPKKISSVALVIHPWTDSERIPVTLTYTRESLLFQEETAFLHKEELDAFGEWLRKLWSTGDVFSLAHTSLRATLSHREHIGERYMDLFYGTEWICRTLLTNAEREEIQEELEKQRKQ